MPERFSAARIPGSALFRKKTRKMHTNGRIMQTCLGSRDGRKRRNAENAGTALAICIPGFLFRTQGASAGARYHRQESMSTNGIRDRDGGAAALIDDVAMAALAADVGPENLVTVLVAFIDELQRRVPVLQGAVDAGDIAAIARETHSIKGSALTFGAAALGAAARRANDASRAGDSRVALLGAREVLALMPETREAVARLAAQTSEVQ